MDRNKTGQDNLPEEISWMIPEYDGSHHTVGWYFLMLIIGIAIIVYSIFTHNILFILIIILAGATIFIHDRREINMLPVRVNGEGVKVGSKFYEYSEIKDFSIVYKPDENIKNLYIEFKSGMRHRLSIPLFNINPIVLRGILLKYAKEDLDRVVPPLSESITRFLGF